MTIRRTSWVNSIYYTLLTYLYFFVWGFLLYSGDRRWQRLLAVHELRALPVGAECGPDAPKLTDSTELELRSRARQGGLQYCWSQQGVNWSWRRAAEVIGITREQLMDHCCRLNWQMCDSDTSNVEENSRVNELTKEQLTGSLLLADTEQCDQHGQT